MRRPPTEEQKAKAAERRAGFRALARRLADMPEADRATLAARIGQVVTVEGRVLSMTNALLLTMQRDAVTLVGGFRQWRAAGRAVRKGEHGLSIWIPSTRTKAADGDGASAQKTEGTGEALAAATDGPDFFMGTVFDVSQTDEEGDGGRG